MSKGGNRSNNSNRGSGGRSRGGNNRTGQSNPNWPSRSGNASGGGRGNNPPKK